MTVRILFFCIGAVAFLGATILPVDQLAQYPPRTSQAITTLREAISRIETQQDSTVRCHRADDILNRVKTSGGVLTEDSTVLFLYHGPAHRVFIPGDMNGWSPSADSMRHIPQTELWYCIKSIPLRGRVEYKLIVDSTWLLDPLNPRQSAGGFGPNSEIRMPGYAPPPDIVPHKGVPHGRIDTIAFPSLTLACSHPVFIYLPALSMHSDSALPAIVITDGGDYLSLGRMSVVLDNLIAAGSIRPVIGVFVDPRTDIGNPASNKRMAEYAINDRFVSFVCDELLPSLRKVYPIAGTPARTAILGSSMGGLIATYAAIRRPDVFGLCAAQSPSYWWRDNEIITIVDSLPRKAVRFYIDTGTIHDAQVQTRLMQEILSSKGYDFSYAEYPEGHNWSNWRSRLAKILIHFWGTR